MIANYSSKSFKGDKNNSTNLSNKNNSKKISLILSNKSSIYSLKSRNYYCSSNQTNLHNKIYSLKNSNLVKNKKLQSKCNILNKNNPKCTNIIKNIANIIKVKKMKNNSKLLRDQFSKKKKSHSFSSRNKSNIGSSPNLNQKLFPKETMLKINKFFAFKKFNHDFRTKITNNLKLNARSYKREFNDLRKRSMDLFPINDKYSVIRTEKNNTSNDFISNKENLYTFNKINITNYTTQNNNNQIYSTYLNSSTNITETNADYKYDIKCKRKKNNNLPIHPNKLGNYYIKKNDINIPYNKKNKFCKIKRQNSSFSLTFNKNYLSQKYSKNNSFIRNNSLKSEKRETNIEEVEMNHFRIVSIIQENKKLLKIKEN